MSSADSRAPKPPAAGQAAGAWVRGVLLFALGGLAGGALAANATRSGRETAAQPPVQARSPDDAATVSEPSNAASSAPAVPPADVSTALSRAPLRFLAVGGGNDPTSTQVQLEQDVALFVETLRELTGAEGATLFAGGPALRAVQLLDSPAQAASDSLGSLRARLGELVDPRPERAARYRAPNLPVHASAKAGGVLTLLAQQLELPGSRLELFVASHGDLGEAPADNYVALWGDTSFDARQLSEALTPPAAQRGARVVLTACYGGGFAELAFEGADASAGATSADVCGLFATSAEHESNGCDPNPDRQSQEGYALHLLHALRGQDRDGASVLGIDLDRDGQVGLLEAHTRARIASRSIDLPSTTSERFLRHLASLPREGEAASASDGAEGAYATPEEDAVIRALGSVLGVASEEQAEAARLAIEAQLDQGAAVIEERALAEDDAQRALLLEVGTRWPELLDPFRPDFEETLQAHARELAAILGAPVARAHAHARRDTDRALLAEEALRERWVQLVRLSRAFETRRLARALAASRPRSDPARQRYEAFLACERAPLAATAAPR